MGSTLRPKGREEATWQYCRQLGQLPGGSHMASSWSHQIANWNSRLKEDRIEEPWFKSLAEVTPRIYIRRISNAENDQILSTSERWKYQLKTIRANCLIPKIIHSFNCFFKSHTFLEIKLKLQKAKLNITNSYFCTSIWMLQNLQKGPVINSGSASYYWPMQKVRCELSLISSCNRNR